MYVLVTGAVIRCHDRNQLKEESVFWLRVPGVALMAARETWQQEARPGGREVTSQPHRKQRKQAEGEGSLKSQSLPPATCFL